MTVTLHDPSDLPKLQRLVRQENNAKQRDRYRAVLLAATRKLEGDEIAGQLGRSPRFVDEWISRYRREGIGALRPRRQPGRRPKLNRGQETLLKQRLDAGARDDDGVCSLRGRDICRIIEQEFGVVHTLGGIYDVLKRLGYSSLAPRPRHRKNDVEAMRRFEQDHAPFLPGQ